MARAKWTKAMEDIICREYPERDSREVAKMVSNLCGYKINHLQVIGKASSLGVEKLVKKSTGFDFKEYQNKIKEYGESRRIATGTVYYANGITTHLAND